MTSAAFSVAGKRLPPLPRPGWQPGDAGTRTAQGAVQGSEAVCAGPGGLASTHR